MRFIISSEQIRFFNERGFIEFEDLLSAKEMVSLTSSIPSQSALQCYKDGRDQWKSDANRKQILFKIKWATIAKTLFVEKPLRMAFDQDLRSFDTFQPIFDKRYSLQQISSIQNLVGAFVIRLTEGPELENGLDFCPIPKKAGNAIFFKTDLPFSFDPFLNVPNQAAILVAYCKENSVYMFQPNDPHTHTLKKEGYVFGDRLKNQTHPIILCE